MSTTTSSLGLYQPANGETGWGSSVNANWTTLDSAVSQASKSSFSSLTVTTASVTSLTVSSENVTSLSVNAMNVTTISVTNLTVSNFSGISYVTPTDLGLVP